MSSEFPRILFYIPTLKGGGAEKVFVNLINYFHSKNIKVLLVTSYREEGYWQLLDSEIEVRILVSKRKFNNRILDRVHRLVLSYILLNRFINRFNPTHVFTTLDEANTISYLVSKQHNNVKFVVRQASIFSIKKNGYLRNNLLKKSFLNADCVFANSPDTATSITDWIGNLEKVVTIGNPAYSESIGSEGNSAGLFPFKYILSVGRLEAPKNYPLLIKAFSKLTASHPEIQLVILGKGSLEANLREMILNLNLEERIHILGFVPDPIPFYKEAEVFVCSSQYEGFGNVLVEALGQGVPVVSTDCKGGPNFILDHGKYGVLVDLDDPQQMADQIGAILDGKILYDKEVLITRAKEFSIENIGSQYLNIFLSDKKKEL